jgi:hypothetical protein
LWKRVQRDVAGEGLVVQRVLFQHRVDFGEAGARLGQHDAGDAALGREPRHQAFDGAAQLDRVGDVTLGKGPHRVAAVGQGLQQPLLLQAHEGRPDRRARDAEALDQRQLRDAGPARQLPRQDHLAQPQLGLDRLRGAGVVGGQGQAGAHAALSVYMKQA